MSSDAVNRVERAALQSSQGDLNLSLEVNGNQFFTDIVVSESLNMKLNIGTTSLIPIISLIWILSLIRITSLITDRNHIILIDKDHLMDEDHLIDKDHPFNKEHIIWLLHVSGGRFRSRLGV